MEKIKSWKNHCGIKIVCSQLFVISLPKAYLELISWILATDNSCRHCWSQQSKWKVWSLNKNQGQLNHGELFVSNHIVVYKGKCGHQNCIDGRKTCPSLGVWQPFGQINGFVYKLNLWFWAQYLGKNFGLYTSFVVIYLLHKGFWFHLNEVNLVGWSCIC